MRTVFTASLTVLAGVAVDLDHQLCVLSTIFVHLVDAWKSIALWVNNINHTSLKVDVHTASTWVSCKDNSRASMRSGEVCCCSSECGNLREPTNGSLTRLSTWCREVQPFVDNQWLLCDWFAVEQQGLH